ncbi:YeeE/YedE thiosulfate transporter family protein [Roseovarius sp.]|uniref:YeeE/YedE thiosulfate transporter family protein n=1 Tax=Roseovarius sp. TaxID=1486281 RepID=UPI0026286761|nr:YeeE/YedE thiosulfate transporter family protein [Roseovarius sp.]
MLLELYDFGLEVRTLHILLGAALGVVFGVAAQVSRFCLRRAVAGDPAERKSAAGVWLTALAVAILTVQGLSLAGFVVMSDHRWLANDLPLAALILGGLAFGAGMVLTRGCASRLTVLGASGNLRALTVLIIFAITAHAMLKGVLSPIRTAIGSFSVPTPITSLVELPGGAALWAALIALPLLAFAARSGARRGDLLLGGLIGLVAAAGWAGTSVLLMDEFDPLPTQSIAFTLPWTETLFWTIASTAIPASFGNGFVGGVLTGAFASALLRGELQLQTFESSAQTLRYGAGGLLMGAGGVLAGGCTVGAGLAGGASLSVAALVALGAILAGAAGTSAALSQTSFRGARASA